MTLFFSTRLVKGAAEGEGLGNAFLSNINACDGIYHLLRAFDDKDIIHVDGDVDPVRDLKTIRAELLAKDVEAIKNKYEVVAKEARVNQKVREKKLALETMDKLVAWVEAGNDVRFGDWTPFDIEVLNTMQLLTAKPTVYLVNLSQKNYISKKNKHLNAIAEYVQSQPQKEPLIPYSVQFEAALADLGSDEERAAFCEEKGAPSAFKRIIWAGYRSLHLQHFYTVGKDEVKCWTIRQRTKAPQAAGTIHGDFEKCFIKAQVMKYSDLEEHGDEIAVKEKGLLKDKGKDYVMEDGDIVHFQHNATK